MTLLKPLIKLNCYLRGDVKSACVDPISGGAPRPPAEPYLYRVGVRSIMRGFRDIHAFTQSVRGLRNWNLYAARGAAIRRQ